MKKRISLFLIAVLLIGILATTATAAHQKADPSRGYSTITFVSNGGTTVAPITAPAGTPISEPQAPKKAGATFVGWYREPTLTYSFLFNVMPAYDVTLYARWNYGIVLPPVPVTPGGGGGIWLPPIPW